MKLTADYLEFLVSSEDYTQNGTLTVCVVTTKSGFKLVGKSACLDERNFDAEVGKKLARKDAVDQLWALEGYYWSRVQATSELGLLADKILGSMLESL